MKMSPKCKRYKSSDLMFYIRAKMTPEEELELQHHLLSCEECREELQRLRDTIDSVERAESISVASSFKRIYLITAAAAAILIGGLFTIPLWNDNASTPLQFEPAPQYNTREEVIMEQDSVQKDSVCIEIEVVG